MTPIIAGPVKTFHSIPMPCSSRTRSRSSESWRKAIRGAASGLADFRRTMPVENGLLTQTRVYPSNGPEDAKRLGWRAARTCRRAGSRQGLRSSAARGECGDAFWWATLVGPKKAANATMIGWSWRSDPHPAYQTRQQSRFREDDRRDRSGPHEQRRRPGTRQPEDER